LTELDSGWTESAAGTFDKGRRLTLLVGGRHALTLTLFGGFLKCAFHGDIRKCDLVKLEPSPSELHLRVSMARLASRPLIRLGAKRKPTM
jgi:hypothetical protein